MWKVLSQPKNNLQMEIFFMHVLLYNPRQVFFLYLKKSARLHIMIDRRYKGLQKGNTSYKTFANKWIGFTYTVKNFSMLASRWFSVFMSSKSCSLAAIMLLRWRNKIFLILVSPGVSAFTLFSKISFKHEKFRLLKRTR